MKGRSENQLDILESKGKANRGKGGLICSRKEVPELSGAPVSSNKNRIRRRKSLSMDTVLQWGGERNTSTSGMEYEVELSLSQNRLGWV